MINRLSKSIRQYRKVSLLAPFFVTLEVIMEVLVPTIMAYLIDNGINKGDMNAIGRIGFILIIACILSLIFGVLSGKYAAEASTGFAANLRKDMFYRVQDFSFANIDKFSSSSIVTRLTTDITNLQNAYQMIVRVAVRCPVMLVFALIMAFNVNHKLALVFLSAIPILGVGIFFIMKNAHPVFEKVFKMYDSLNLVVQENLRGMRVVKSFVREDFEEKKFKNVSKDIYDNSTKAEKLLMFNMPLMQFAMYGCILLISWFGAKLILTDSMTTGELMSMFSYATQILMSLMMFSMVFVMVTMSRASAERISEILDEESTLKNNSHPVFDVRDGSVDFENVFFSYSDTDSAPVLNNISLSIKSGDTIGIIGGTGSSKSSLVQLIPRLFDVTGGTVRVGGVDVRDYDIETLRDAVSMVLQKNELFSGTIKDNIRWGDENASDKDIERVCKLAQAHEFIKDFPDGYDTYIEQGGSNVSGGQKQRLCIARALLKKPKILILDDSTSAVDTKTDSLIRRAFAEEIPDTTKIIIAQRISSVQDSDKIIILENGHIDSMGTHSELMETSDIYRELYYSQMKGGEE
ncbi:ABC transporter ATP-binding protein/permease [Lachnospiraceae bacterium NSJ-143]|nr:ABC transporter ATP-binding protein/permease [Lachnospiraceae bacterium NSJ-143]